KEPSKWIVESAPPGSGVLVGRLVGKRKRTKTQRLAFDKLQLRGRRPLRKKPPSPSHDERLDQEPVLIDQACSHQRLNQGRAPIDNDILARLLFQWFHEHCDQRPQQT